MDGDDYDDDDDYDDEEEVEYDENDDKNDDDVIIVILTMIFIHIISITTMNMMRGVPHNKNQCKQLLPRLLRGAVLSQARASLIRPTTDQPTVS